MVHTNLVYSNDDQERVYQNVNFMTPGRRAWSYKSQIENALFLQTSYSLLLGLVQTN